MTPRSCLKVLKHLVKKGTLLFMALLFDKQRTNLENPAIYVMIADIGRLLHIVKRGLGGELPRVYADCKA